jgi:AbrB family looped-hinge helix DNA binding protein
MSKVTSKLQVTIPKAIAERYSIVPGDELEWEPTAEFVRIVPSKKKRHAVLDARARLRLFDAATKRQRDREVEEPRQADSAHDRGWTREELYERGGSR